MNLFFTANFKEKKCEKYKETQMFNYEPYIFQ